MKLVIYAFLIIVALLIESCTQGFDDLNIDKSKATEINSSTVQNLLRGIIFEPINSNLDVQIYLTNQIMQYNVWRAENNLDRYDFAAGNSLFTSFWQKHYKAIRDINDILKFVETNPDNKLYGAVARIMRSYYILTISELWGNVPYVEASLGSGNIQPKYDTQQSIYIAALNDLRDANTELKDNGTLSFSNTIIYSGDKETRILKWRKLANSLRIRYLLRASDKITDAKTTIENMLVNSTEFPIMVDNSDSAVYDFSGSAPDASSFSLLAGSNIEGITPSVRLVSLFDGVDADVNTDDDPRLAFFARIPVICRQTDEEIAKLTDEKKTEYDNHCAGTSKNKYIGAVNGTTREIAQATGGGNADLYSSFFTTRFQDNKGLYDFVIMNYAELQFILAELKQKNWNNVPNTAKSYYDAGITATFNYWNITMPAGFLARTDVVWDNTLDRLMDQKWAAMYMVNTIVSWADYKRTSLPALTIGTSAMSQSPIVPPRVFYPTIEQSVNASNYKTEVPGEESITKKHWYQP